jgi:hypothetical protein
MSIVDAVAHCSTKSNIDPVGREVAFADVPALSETFVSPPELDHRIEDLLERVDERIVYVDLKMEVTHSGYTANPTIEDVEEPKYCGFTVLFYQWSEGIETDP